MIMLLIYAVFSKTAVKILLRGICFYFYLIKNFAKKPSKTGIKREKNIQSKTTSRQLIFLRKNGFFVLMWSCISTKNVF